MGADIHSFAEVRRKGKWEKIIEPIFTEGTEPFGWRSYSLFGFLANVRNYAHCVPIAECRGLPEDSEYLNSISKYAYKSNPITEEAIPEEKQDKLRDDIINDWDYHSSSWLTLKELLDFNYEKTFWDRRITKGSNGAALAEQGEGEIISYRQHLGEGYFDELEILKTLGNPEDVRIVFWFDN